MSTLERLVSSLNARKPHVKVVAVVTGGGISAAESLFIPGSSSTMLHFAVPYSRASLQSYLSSVPSLSQKIEFCSAETSERMALAAWKHGKEILRQEADADNKQMTLISALKRFRASFGIACTAALATNYSKVGPHECFLSVCHAEAASKNNNILLPQFRTYHLLLDKSLGRSRIEEDQIVGRWLIYFLAKAANVDPDICNSFYDELKSARSGADSVVKVSSDRDITHSNDPLRDIKSNKSEQLVSVAFLPDDSQHSADGSNPIIAVQEFDFRGLILPGSFNPVHQGHIGLARAAQQLVKARTGVEYPVAFELAIANVDKGAIDMRTVSTRVAQFSGKNALGLGAWPVLVTNAALFQQKSDQFPGCIFVIGTDTAIRIVSKNYYSMDEHKIVLALSYIARNGCSFVVAGRFDQKFENRFISAEETLNKHVPPVFRHIFVPLPESSFRNDISSSTIRARVATI
ncbi:hypothetical protein CCR75_006511 [Bremia lactucae]|uniref:Cytidyltransferase-like domain-containing protein n=1 Tax=Bremia lactucae TaxID=4779 RepID=A0A976FFG5_BRELC|nr:hypothetical protein CCR75_006511 [Bremia lactucae]